MATLDEEEEGRNNASSSAEPSQVSTSKKRDRPVSADKEQQQDSLPLTGDPRESTQAVAAAPSEQPSSLEMITPIALPDQSHVAADESRHYPSPPGNGGDFRHRLTPPSKRAKYLFKRCFDATFNPAAVTGAQRVLAPDSDDDEDK